MTGYEICKKAFLRLGLEGQNEVVLHKNTSFRDLEFINQIAEDLKLSPLEEMSAVPSWSYEELQAVICGVAMLLSFSEGENSKNQLYTSIYNAKRAALLGKVEKIEDTLPNAESGEV